MTTFLYNDFTTTAQLDEQYDIEASVTDFDGYVREFIAQSQAVRAELPNQLDVPYGPTLDETFDVFFPPQDVNEALRPAVFFVHGGYWLDFGREEWSHLAAGALARGWACAMPSYTLAPAARIRDMTAEVAAAVTHAAGLVAGPVVVTGHSAGGHLAARMGCADLALPRVARVVPISPLSDLRPLMETSMQDSLHLDPAECLAESPALLPLRAGSQAHVWVGGQERPSFLWQARLLSEAWDCPWTVDAGRHHFDVIDALADPASPLMAACLDGLG